MVKKSERTEITSDEIVDLRPLPMVAPHGNSAFVTGVYRINESVSYPEYQTSASGCLDLAADLGTHNAFLKYWDTNMGREGNKGIRDDSTGRHILIEPGDRVLIPTGLIFQFCDGWSMKTFIRSSVGLKKGLMLANGVGYIDEDYRNELFLPIINMSRCQVRVEDKERLAQGEVCPTVQTVLRVLDNRPPLTGNRIGGFGSTNSINK